MPLGLDAARICLMAPNWSLVCIMACWNHQMLAPITRLDTYCMAIDEVASTLQRSKSFNSSQPVQLACIAVSVPDVLSSRFLSRLFC